MAYVGPEALPDLLPSGKPVLGMLLVSVIALQFIVPSNPSVASPRPDRVFAACKAGEGRMEVIKGWLLSEPSFSGTVIPARTYGLVGSEDIWKLIRIYFPRTYREMTAYDFILLASVDMQFFTPKQIKWMYDAITTSGLGGMNTRSVQSCSTAWSASWMNSVISQAFPNDVPAVLSSRYYATGVDASGPIVVNDGDVPPLIKPYKRQIERAFPAYRGLITIPRAGSTIYTWVRCRGMKLGDPSPGLIPHLFSWKYQNGTTFTSMDMVFEPFWKEDRNPFSLDVIANVVWCATGRKLPTDAMMVHELRNMFRSYQTRKTCLVGMFDFAEAFGANTKEAYSILSRVDEEKSQADRQYLDGDFQKSYSTMESLMKEIGDLEDLAIAIKDRALLWIYLIEWLVVSATMLACVSAIWELMVRRLLYKEAKATRFG